MPVNDPSSPFAEPNVAALPSDAPQGWLRARGASVGAAACLALVGAAVLSPLFATPFAVLFGRTLLLAMVLLLAYAAGLRWPARWRPSWVPAWLLPPLMVALAAPLSTFVIYLVWVGGDVRLFLSSAPALIGFSWIAGTGLIVGLLLSLGALLREEEAKGRQQALRFALERSRLEQQAIEARRVAAEFQLQRLRRQIEPHFLFNTLANVQALVESGSPRAATLLQCLIAYLRASVPALDDAHATLGDELTRVRAYLELMRLRMPDRLTWREDVDARLQSERLPPLALLTLVENAIRHGIDPSERGGEVCVGARSDGQGFALWVADTGVGPADTVSEGTGLQNLRDTLEAFYGGRARLSVAAETPSGWRATIHVGAASEAGG